MDDESSPIAIPHLVEMVVASTRYLGALTVLTDDDMRGPSLLPGWTRGHVVTHLARNADAFCNLVHWAETGVVTPMYASQDRRDADIEAGAGRSAHDLRVDAAASSGRLLQAVNELDVRHEQVQVSREPGSPTFPVREVATRRRLELEVHHADLDVGFTHRDWDVAFAGVLLDRVREDRAAGPPFTLRATDTGGSWTYGAGEGPVVTGTAVDLAWFALGRGDGAGLECGSGDLPELPKWR